MYIESEATKALNRYYRVAFRRSLYRAFLRVIGTFSQIVNRLVARSVKKSIIQLSLPQLHNIGDLAISKELIEYCKNTGVRVVTLNIQKSQSWKFPNARIVGGGSIVNTDVMMNILRHPAKTQIIGAEIFGNIKNYGHPNHLTRVCVRSERSKARAEEYGLGGVEVAPDLAFLPSEFKSRDRQKGRHFVVGVNATAWPKPDHFRRSHAASLSLDPEIIRYTSWIRTVCKSLSENGATIIGLETEYGDNLFLRSVLEDLISDNIHFPKFVPSVKHCRILFGDCDLIVATRYHSHIFALQQGIPLVSVAYSMQVEQLQEQLRIGECYRYPNWLPASTGFANGFELEHSELIELQGKIQSIVDEVLKKGGEKS